MDTLLSLRAGTDFSPHTSLCKVLLLEIKLSSEEKSPASLDLVSSPVLGIFHYVKQIEEISSRSEPEILDDLQNSMVGSVKRNYRKFLETVSCQTTVDLAIRCGLHIYALDKIKTSLQQSTEQKPLLSHLLAVSLRPQIQVATRSEFYWKELASFDIEFLRCLLEYGACPNLHMNNPRQSRKPSGK
jgi:hypothetical protein